MPDPLHKDRFRTDTYQNEANEYFPMRINNLSRVATNNFQCSDRQPSS